MGVYTLYRIATHTATNTMSVVPMHALHTYIMCRHVKTTDMVSTHFPDVVEVPVWHYLLCPKLLVLVQHHM